MALFPWFKQKPKQTPKPETELRLHRCAFTGHRPEKLETSEKEIKSRLQQEIQAAIAEGFTTFLSGGSRGTDLWAAQIVLDFRKRDQRIKLICVIPFEDFGSRWPNLWQRQYRSVIKAADYVKVIGTGYSDGIYQQRNMYMVDHCSRLIAVYNGTPGGTRNTIAYAEECTVPTVIIKG